MFQALAVQILQSPMKQANLRKPKLPTVVQLGFSGSRELFEGLLVDAPQAIKLCAAAEVWLDHRLDAIRTELRLDANQFIVGISQIACGADTVFTKVCQRKSIPQRFFLPQPLELFLGGSGTDGQPDFSQAQRAQAEALLSSSHVSQVRVASSSVDRSTRFEEANFEIMRVSDVMVCLLRAGVDGGRGGTRQLMKRAIKRGLPVLEIQVEERNQSLAIVEDRWHNVYVRDYQPPANLPAELAKLPFPPQRAGQESPSFYDDYCDALSEPTSRQADVKQKLFMVAAGLIVATHIVATILAASALAMHSLSASHGPSEHASPWVILVLLAVEFGLLAFGFLVHYAIHHSHAVQEWASARVVRELIRSLRSVGTRHLYLSHLFRLHLPHHYRPLLRTLNVLHLKATWPNRFDPWQPQRDRYLQERFDDPVHGQIQFYEKSLKKDERLMKVCQRIFLASSLFAMASTALKIWLLGNHFSDHSWLAFLGGLGVTLPVLAVGGLSWAAAVDCEARIETFRETLRFLRRQRPYLEQATSDTEFDQLLLETETVLLGEVTTWYSRRSSKGVS